MKYCKAKINGVGRNREFQCGDELASDFSCSRPYCILLFITLMLGSNGIYLLNRLKTRPTKAHLLELVYRIAKQKEEHKYQVFFSPNC